MAFEVDPRLGHHVRQPGENLVDEPPLEENVL
jgi:hypothetical protein